MAEREIPTRPDRRLAMAADRFGEQEVARWCSELLLGEVEPDARDRPDLAWLAGIGGADYVLLPRQGGPRPDYWPRVWSARGLLYVWDPSCVPAVRSGLGDDHWRVREMCAKVVLRRDLFDLLDDTGPLITDAVPRVRCAALRIYARYGDSEHAEAIVRAIEDDDPHVSDIAFQMLRVIEERLDRSFEP